MTSLKASLTCAALSSCLLAGCVGEAVGGEGEALVQAELFDRAGAPRTLEIERVSALEDGSSRFDVLLDGRALSVQLTPADQAGIGIEVRDADGLLASVVSEPGGFHLTSPSGDMHLAAGAMMPSPDLDAAFDEGALLLTDVRAVELMRGVAVDAHLVDGDIAGQVEAAKPMPPSPPPAPVWRDAVETMSASAQQALFNGIIAVNLGPERITVPVENNEVMHFDMRMSRRTVMTPVSVVRSHYAIHHHNTRNPETFLTHHRTFMGNVEGFLIARGVAMPFGHLPAWSPANPVPAVFQATPPPPRNCNTQGMTTTNCDYEANPLATFTPNMPTPANLQGAQLCAVGTQDALAQRLEPWHDTVHNTLGGSMLTFDSPGAPLFWIWHGYVDQIWQNWLNCPR